MPAKADFRGRAALDDDCRLDDDCCLHNEWDDFADEECVPQLPALQFSDFLLLNPDGTASAPDWTEVDFDVRSLASDLTAEDDGQRFRGASQPVGAQRSSRGSSSVPHDRATAKEPLVHKQLRRLLRDRHSLLAAAGSSVPELQQLLAVKMRQEARRERLDQYRESSLMRARAYRAERSAKASAT
jgi:hypothetical protein